MNNVSKIIIIDCYFILTVIANSNNYDAIDPQGSQRQLN